VNKRRSADWKKLHRGRKKKPHQPVEGTASPSQEKEEKKGTKVSLNRSKEEGPPEGKAAIVGKTSSTAQSPGRGIPTFVQHGGRESERPPFIFLKEEKCH